MFGHVTANAKALTQQEQDRYGGVYCGICRQIRERFSQTARLGLSYDMAFLALLLMSLYEPEEREGRNACLIHPCRKRGWVESEYVCYAADMNVALAYYKALDDVADDGRMAARFLVSRLKGHMPRLEQEYPRQCEAISRSIEKLSALEKENCDNPDLPAGCFGELMGEILVYREDLWAPTLRNMGMALGRYIYLADAAIDYGRDQKKKKYNPFLAMGMEADWQRWEQYLVLTLGRCTGYFEQLPLVQDKKLLDNILYSGIWMEFRRHDPRAREDTHDTGSL